MIRIAPRRITPFEAIDEPRVLRVGPRQHLGRMRDVADQVGHRALGLGHRRHQRRRAGRLGQPDVEQHVGLPVDGELLDRDGHLGDQRVEALDRLRLGPFGGQHGDAELDRHPDVAAVAPVGEHLGARRPDDRRRLGHERAAAAAPHGVQVAGLHQRGQRLAQRGSRDPELLAQVALRREPRAGREQAELDRRAKPFQRLLEGGRGLDRREDGVGDHSRSNPRERSQSVTNDSKASSSTRALFR